MKLKKDYKIVTKYPPFSFAVLLKISLHSLVTKLFVQDTVTHKTVLFAVTTGIFRDILHTKCFVQGKTMERHNIPSLFQYKTN